MLAGGEVRGGGSRARRWWMVTAGAAVLGAALWLREPTVPYLIACATATALTAALTALVDAPRGWAAAFVGAALVFCAAAGLSQRGILRVERDWAAESARIAATDGRALADALAATAAELRESASRALDAPPRPEDAFRYLAMPGDDRRWGRHPRGERGVVLYRAGAPVAWGGRIRALPDSLAEPLGASASPFYLTLYAVARRGGDYAVATAVVHAEPPADRLTRPLDHAVAARGSAKAFEYVVDGEAPPGFTTFAPGGVPLFAARAAPPAQAEALLRRLERARIQGALLLALSVVCFLVATWRRQAPLARRLAALAVMLGALAVIPLSAFSNLTNLVDPAYYFAPFGGPFTASVAALGLTGGTLLLALLAVLRSPVRYPSRAVALLVVVAVAGLGPFLLRDVARGISPPARGVTMPLWLAWEVTSFLVAVSILLAGASAGRAALGGRRGLPAQVAPTIAAVAALLGPVLWEAPGRWPGWYPALWIAAIIALALTRRARGFVLTAALVAGSGSATLVWGATARKRVELATRDLAGLGAADQYARGLLERFADQLAGEVAPTTRAELLRRYVASDLAAAEYPVGLAAWAPQGAVAGFDLAVSALNSQVAGVAALARAAGTTQIVELPASPGVQLLAAVPHPDGVVTTVVVGPRTRLLPADPFSVLLGLTREQNADPPYTLSPLIEVPAREARQTDAPRWTRRGNELHGDWTLMSAGRPMRAHVEVDLRSLEALAQRGVLIVLVDLAVVAALWTLTALADGGLARWVRGRARGWMGSYRARITVALAGFFVVPAVVFAVWSYRRLQTDDRQSRELVVRETLRAVRPADDFDQLPAASNRLDSPLLLYHEGTLTRASDVLYDLLAPAGRFLPPDVHQALDLADEVTANRQLSVGGVSTMFGYRIMTGLAGERVVLAAPARGDEVALDRRRRDLGTLVLFSTLAGVLAALWSSGVAAREFARPIGELRQAALAIAAGEREPVLTGRPPLEFRPVFSAFRRMAADLAASRSALEEAQRRTAAVLRNVASGVVAVDGHGSVILANPRADALLGRRLPPGTPLAALGAPEIEQRVAEFLWGAGAPEGAVTRREPPGGRLFDGDEVEFDAEVEGRQLHGRLARLAGGDGGAVLTLDDVTELARAQRVLAWGEMARQVAHEIKNPLTPIRLGVQHLRRAHADRRVDFDQILGKNVERILAEIDRLDEIARAFSRYGTAPNDRPPGAPIDVAAVVRDVVELERMGVGSLDWELSGADRPVVARARKEELREVLLNLLENARLANARRVRVGLARENGRVGIVVEDDGAGITPDVLPRIFEPHFSTRTSGSGLGLATSRRIIDGWGGSIAVSSEVGRGTRVEVTLVADAEVDAGA